jgi:hypothetical protein
MGRSIKWIVALAVVVAALWFLQSRGGEKPITHVETPVKLNDIK